MYALDLFNVPLWIPLVLVLVSLLYIYGTRPYSTWSKLGVPGPRPLPFIGNAHVIRRLGMAGAFQMWKDQYGPLVGVYLMRRPMLLVSDAETAKRILVTDFKSFSHRGYFIPKPFMNQVAGGMLTFKDGAEWKRVRGLLSPTFSTGHLREKSSLMARAADKAVASVVQAARGRQQLNAQELFSTYTMDVILSCLFSVEPSSNRAVAELFRKWVPLLVRPSPFRLKMYILAGMFPFLTKFLGTISDESRDGQTFYTEFVKQSLEERKDSSVKFSDFLQNMISSDTSGDDGDEGEEEKKTRVEKLTLDKLTFEELVSQTNLFFMAGNDTSSHVLVYLTYILAHHQDVQEKILGEISRELGDEEAPNYDNVQKLKYLEACILEALRLNPSVVTITRNCVEATRIGGIPVPEGAGIYVPVATLGMNPDVYADPEKFIPNRFIKNDPDEVKAPFLAFGLGPRMCIGMKFAMLQIAVAIVGVLRKVRVVSATSYVIPPTMMFGIPPMTDDVYFGVQLRTV